MNLKQKNTTEARSHRECTEETRDQMRNVKYRMENVLLHLVPGARPLCAICLTGCWAGGGVAAPLK
jgi:hypothetical protein